MVCLRFVEVIQSNMNEQKNRIQHQLFFVLILWYSADPGLKFEVNLWRVENYYILEYTQYIVILNP